MISREELIKSVSLNITTLGGRSNVSFKFSDKKIISINSKGNSSAYSWTEFEAVQQFCQESGYQKPGIHYNPMDGGTYPINYPKSQDTLSLVALAHYVARKHKHH